MQRPRGFSLGRCRGLWKPKLKRRPSQSRVFGRSSKCVELLAAHCAIFPIDLSPKVCDLGTRMRIERGGLPAFFLSTRATFLNLLSWNRDDFFSLLHRRDAKFLAKKICVDGDLRLNLRREAINVFQDHRHTLVLSQFLACADQEVPVKNCDRTC